jgi:hypothetical protein
MNRRYSLLLIFIIMILTSSDILERRSKDPLYWSKGPSFERTKHLLPIVGSEVLKHTGGRGKF